MTTIATPCIKVCTLDPVEKLCLGCGRSGDEIAGWLRLTPAERDAVMAELPARRAALDARFRARAAGDTDPQTGG